MRISRRRCTSLASARLPRSVHGSPRTSRVSVRRLASKGGSSRRTGSSRRKSSRRARIPSTRAVSGLRMRLHSRSGPIISRRAQQRRRQHLRRSARQHRLLPHRWDPARASRVRRRRQRPWRRLPLQRKSCRAMPRAQRPRLHRQDQLQRPVPQGPQAPQLHPPVSAPRHPRAMTFAASRGLRRRSSCFSIHTVSPGMRRSRGGASATPSILAACSDNRRAFSARDGSRKRKCSSATAVRPRTRERHRSPQHAFRHPLSRCRQIRLRDRPELCNPARRERHQRSRRQRRTQLSQPHPVCR